MPMTPTATHAVNLFTLTMESRFGAKWDADLEPDVVVGFAEEVAKGFGGQRQEAGARAFQADPGAVLWLLPDGSQVVTGGFGLREVAEATAPAATHGHAMAS